jgi:hypothetical protein
MCTIVKAKGRRETNCRVKPEIKFKMNLKLKYAIIDSQYTAQYIL